MMAFSMASRRFLQVTGRQLPYRLSAQPVNPLAAFVALPAHQDDVSHLRRGYSITSSPVRAMSFSNGQALPAGKVRQSAAAGMLPRAATVAPLAPVHTAVDPKHDMFCFQCEQTRDGKGCMTVGVCGKDPMTAGLQDLLIHALKGLSQYAHRLHLCNQPLDPQMNFFVQEAVFATLTNVNFDATAITGFLMEAVAHRDALKARYNALPADVKAAANANAAPLHTDAADFHPATDVNVLQQQAKMVGVEERRVGWDEDIFSLQELLTYGIKGTAAYAAHAAALNQRDESISHFLYEAMDYLTRPPEQQTMERLLELSLGCGAANMTAMEVLQRGHATNFGIPEPSVLKTSPVPGKCILVSGHDMADLYALLVATQGKGINVYTHGELLPAHGYPKMKEFPHLIGNYGGPWQLQKMEFAAFPGPVLVTTNCLLEPKPSYQDRIYSANAAGHSKVQHIRDRDFAVVIDQALQMEGFSPDHPMVKTPPTTTMTGFGHDAVLSVAGEVVQAVKEGRIKRFFLIGGCDGFEGERSYYRDLALGLPKETVVLTLACGKYRFNKEMDKFGLIPGTNLPRLMDMGQCNDAFSAIKVAQALSNVFETDINSLPLSIVLSWFEQKAVAVLLTLLHLNVQNIRIGPKLPAFVTPNVLQVLVDKYRLTPISGPDKVQEDMKAMMG